MVYATRLAHLERLTLVSEIDLLISALQGYAVSQAGELRRVDLYWERVLRFSLSGLYWIEQIGITSGLSLLAWIPIMLQAFEPCVLSCRVRPRQKRP